MESVTSAIVRGQARRTRLSEQESALLKRRTELDLVLRDGRDSAAGAAGSKAAAEKELNALQKKIRETRAQLGQCKQVCAW
jgi:hypothetical protein